jgi:hypothetical protein
MVNTNIGKLNLADTNSILAIFRHMILIGFKIYQYNKAGLDHLVL